MTALSRMFFVFFTGLILLGLPMGQAEARISDTQRLKSIVKIYILDEQLDEKARSSGTGLFLANDQVLTALHVVSPLALDNERFTALICVTRTDADEPICAFKSKHVVKYSEKYDLAILSLDLGYDSDTENFLDWAQFIQKYNVEEFVSANDFVRGNSTVSIRSGDSLQILGYPGVGGKTITLTTGVVSGFEKAEIGGQQQVHLIKTDAKINPGNSGGPAFDENNLLVGITTAVRRDISDIGLIVSMQAVKDFMNNRQERTYGEVCYDYVFGDKVDGECICHEGVLWDDERKLCLTDEQQQELDRQQPISPEEDPLPEAEGSEAEQETSENVEEGTDDGSDNTENDSDAEEQETKTTADASGETHILERKMRDVVIAGIIGCKKKAGGDRELLRACLKLEIVGFIKERSAKKRQLQKECRQEEAEDIRMCVAEKVAAGE